MTLRELPRNVVEDASRELANTSKILSNLMLQDVLPNLWTLDLALEVAQHLE
jgi:hypothetical protein